MLTALVFREAYKQLQAEQKFLLVDITESFQYCLKNILWERSKRKGKKKSFALVFELISLKLYCQSFVCLHFMWQPASCYPDCTLEREEREQAIYILC